MKLNVNGQTHSIPEEWRSGTLLDVLREVLGLTGTKFSCGQGICGACTVHVDGAPVRSCVFPAQSAASVEVTTIEGLARGGALHPVQQAWIEESVPQCGYCQTGQIMTAAAFVDSTPEPTQDQISEAMNDCLCRCGTYVRIRRGVARAAEIAAEV